MMKICLLLPAFFLLPWIASAQNDLSAVVLDNASRQPLAGATAVLKGTSNGASADQDGRLKLSSIPDGKHSIIFSLLGYRQQEIEIVFPSADALTVLLDESADELGEVIVEGTRSNRSIADNPTRVEVLTEEIDEASTMDPSKIAHLLTHSTGIQVQQTSATNNTANVRIQGLDGRYTQMLRDGFPLYGGFSGSLSIMQIPPLDLRQIEYIKGGASTLYGGGAISGLINLISKDPSNEETLVHLNASQIGAFDVNAYTSRKTEKIGLTLLAQRNTHQYFDADKDGYSDMPQLTKFNFNPRLFFYLSDNTELVLGGTFTGQKIQGGDVRLMNGQSPDSLHFYRERNEVSRTTTQVKLQHRIDRDRTIAFRNSFNFFGRSLSIVSDPTADEYRFAGKQTSSFSEISYSSKKEKHTLVAGINLYSDDFREDSLQSPVLRNEHYTTLGGFVNFTADVTERISIEAGFRGDEVFGEGFLPLPRLSTLFKWTPELTTRIGGGMGYRNPTVFNQEAEVLGYRNVLPIDRSVVTAERSTGGNADIGFKRPLGEHFFININQMFFYTVLDAPLILVQPAPGASYEYVNADGETRSRGTETFFKFGFYDFVFFAGYTYTRATNYFDDGNSELTLTPRHSLKGDLLYSIPGKWRIGLDYEYKSGQVLSAGIRTRAYWTFGAVVEYTWKQFTFFGNIENYTDVRQTRYQSMRTAPYETPQFTEVWAPLDGRVLNGGIKIRL